MIKIGTKLIVVDNSGAKLAKCIKLMGKQKISTVGNIISVTLLKFKNSKKVKKRTVYLGLIVGCSYWVSRIDGSFIKFFSNRVLVFNKSFKFLGSRVYGGVLKEIRIKSIKDKNYRKFFSENYIL
jgi:large subunit ribosomal protein L14